MKLLKRISNLMFGTNYSTEKFVMPSKQRLVANMYREYNKKEWQ